MDNLKISGVVKTSLAGDATFSARKVRSAEFDGLLDPITGFDHFQLSSDVFGPHPHAGMSAISYLFDDSVPYHNLDSIGTDIVIRPGSLLWTWAGSGVVHTEYPVPDGARVHGLQLFVNIPAARKQEAPKSLYVEQSAIPEITADGVRVKVVLGGTGTTANTITTPEQLTFLDIFLQYGKSFGHILPAGSNATIYVVKGNVTFKNPASTVWLGEGNVIALGAADADAALHFTADQDAQLILLSGVPLKEQIFSAGAMNMSSAAELEQAITNFKAGKMGFIKVHGERRKVIMPV